MRKEARTASRGSYPAPAFVLPESVRAGSLIRPGAGNLTTGTSLNPSPSLHSPPRCPNNI